MSILATLPFFLRVNTEELRNVCIERITVNDCFQDLAYLISFFRFETSESDFSFMSLGSSLRDQQMPQFYIILRLIQNRQNRFRLLHWHNLGNNEPTI